MLLERIKLLCDEQKITVAELERKLDIANSSIRKWNNGNPGIDKVGKVADFFGVSTDYLLGKTNIRNLPENFSKNDEFDEDTRSLARDYQDLDNDSRDLLKDIIKSMRKKGREANNE